jgi:hypothetical protein
VDRPIEAVNRIGAKTRSLVASLADRATVAGVGGDRVTVQRIGRASVDGKPYAVHGGAMPATGADGWLMNVPGQGLAFLPFVETGGAGVHNVRDAGATGDGATDDTAAIQAAIGAAEAAGGGTVYFPPGDYRVTGLTVTGNSVTLLGAGMWAARIAMAGAAGDTLTIGTTAFKPFYTEIRNLRFAPAVTRNAGAAEVRAFWFYTLTVAHCCVEDAAWAFELGNTDAAKGSEIVNLYNCLVSDVDLGFYLVNTLAPFFRDNRTNTGRLGGATFVIDGGVEGGSFVGGDHVNGATPDASKTGTCLTLRKADYTVSEPRWLKFVACHFDQHRQGLDANAGTDVDFDGCWFSNRPWAGAAVNAGTKRFRFRGCDFTNNGNQGVLLDGGDQHRVVDCAAIGNDQNNAGTHGIYVSNNATNIQVRGCVSRNDPTLFGAGFQDYGIYVNAGSTNYTLVDNDTQGNATGGISHPSGAGAIVANNR